MVRPKFLLVQVIGTHDHTAQALENMQETEALTETYGGVVVKKMVQHRVKPHPATYVGLGKVVEIKQWVITGQINVVVINGLVKPSQLFRVERLLWNDQVRVQVWDRLDLILGIFEKHAVTREAKLQIELARIAHAGPRIYGLGGKELSGQRGGIGQRGGMGETNIEMEKRRMKVRQQQINKELAKLTGQKQRRLEYRREQGFGPVALVGYTSAGKTTLFNRLTGKDKPSNASLFTTLDTVVGKMRIKESALPILISDTIGFIQDLPPQLLAAFKATLMEAMEAKLILQVIDATDEKYLEKTQTVERILMELGVSIPVVKVYNKADKFTGKRQPDGWWVSARTGEGVEKLQKMMVKRLGV